MYQNNASRFALLGAVLISFAFVMENYPNAIPSLWPQPAGEVPVMNLPYIMRTWNYGGGSCVHASTINCLLWQGQDELANYWRKHYAEGESYSGLIAKLQASGVYWAGTYQGDVSFLDWACRTRRGAIIFYYPNHSVNLVHLDEKTAFLLDNNRPGKYIEIDRKEFIYNWKNFGGVAVTPVCSPVPPLPWMKQWIAKMSSSLH